MPRIPLTVESPDNLPPSSPLANFVTAPSDAIVVRGYLGRPDLGSAVELLKNALSDSAWLHTKVVNNLKGAVAGVELTPKTLSDALEKLAPPKDGKLVQDIKKLPDTVPWRVYLSPGLDRYIEFDYKNCLGWRHYDPDVDGDAYLVWLRGRDENGQPIQYYVVDQSPLKSGTAYVTGALFDDYLSGPQSRNNAWNEQQYGGGLTGKSSHTTCTA